MFSGNKKFAIVLVLLFALAQLPLAGAYSDVQDPDAWYYDNVNRWGELLTSEGEFRPNAAVTRGEFAHVINGLMNFPAAGADFDDVSPTDRYAGDIGALQAAGIVEGYNGSFNPNSPITRAEVAIMFVNIFALTPNSSPRFTDASSIPAYVAPYVNALQESGFIGGYPDGTFRPNANLTRAEMIQVIGNAAVNFVDHSSVVTSVARGNMLITRANAHIRDVTVEGDVIIAPGVGDSDVTFENVRVTGSIYIRGGGSNTINITGTSDVTRIISNSALSAGLRVSVAQTANVSALVITGGVGLVELSGSVDTVNMANDGRITISGTVGSLNIVAAGASVDIAASATVGDVYMSPDAAGSVLNIAGTVIELIVAAPAAYVEVAATATVFDLSVTGSAAGAIVDNSGTVEYLAVQSATAEISNAGSILEAAVPSSVAVIGTQPLQSETIAAGSANDVYMR